MRNGRIIKYAARLLLAVIIGVALLGSLPAPVQAAEPIDLVLGGEGATSWNFDDIKPCHSGTKTVTLHNAGTEDGFVTIWISDIVSGEGLNPEPETDTEGEGELDNYLLFNLRTDPDGRLDTDITLPATINEFPPSVDGPGHIWIVPLNAGETVTLYWDWELPCETGNDTQGDTVSFTITYFLEELPTPPPPPPPPAGGPAGFAAAGCYLWIDMLGELTRVRVGCCSNRALEYCRALDPDELHLLEIEEDMKIICGDCTGCRCYPRVVVMSLAEESPTPPDGTVVVGSVYYDFTGYKDTLRFIECDEATFFYPAISMLLSFDPDTLPEGAYEPFIAWYDAEQGIWIPLPFDPDRVAEVGKVTGLTNSFASTFAVLVNVPPPVPPPPPPAPAPAHFVASSLNIAPSVREIWQPVTFVTLTGENVTITVNVANDGGQEGSYLVELKINGETIDKKEVTLGAGQSEQVSFTLSGMEPGQYEVAVSGLSGEFTVLRTINWWLIGGIVAALILLGWLVWYRKRRIRPEPVS